MASKKLTKGSLVASIISLLMCFAMLLGTTFAWFTDTANTAGNKIQAGTLDIVLEMWDEAADEWVNAEGKTLEFYKALTSYEGETVLWEPGCTYKLPKIRVRNEGNLAAKVVITINGIDGDAKLLEAIDFTTTITNANPVVTAEMNKYPNIYNKVADGCYEIAPIKGTDVGTVLWDEGLSPKGVTANNKVTDTTAELTISGHMKEEAGNEYQGKTIEGISVTVLATQCSYEHDSFDDTYDEAATYPKTYTVSNYDELKAAISEANSGDIVKLDADMDLGATQLAVEKDITLDLGGNTVTADNGWGIISLKNGASIANGTVDVDTNVAAIRAFNAGSIKNVTINVAPKATDKVTTGIAVQEGGHVGTIENVTITGASQGIEVYKGATVDLIDNVNVEAVSNGTASGTALQINAGSVGKAVDSTFDGEAYGVHMMLNGENHVALELEDCEVSGGTCGIYAHDEKGISNTTNCSLTLTYGTDTDITGGTNFDFEDECKSVVTLNIPD